jgi:hypothetical protein
MDIVEQENHDIIRRLSAGGKDLVELIEASASENHAGYQLEIAKDAHGRCLLGRLGTKMDGVTAAPTIN